MVKATFSLDDETMEQIRRTAARLGKAQSHVIREAVAEYAARTDRLSERERLHLLGVLEKIAETPANRTARSVDREIKAVRAARRHGGRRRA
jgi:predicted DNA-binding protein